MADKPGRFGSSNEQNRVDAPGPPVDTLGRMPDSRSATVRHTLCMGASRRQAAWVIGATVVITAGTLIYIFATVPPRSQAIEEAVRDAAGATGTDTVMATVTVTETFVQPGSARADPGTDRDSSRRSGSCTARGPGNGQPWIILRCSRRHRVHRFRHADGVYDNRRR